MQIFEMLSVAMHKKTKQIEIIAITENSEIPISIASCNPFTHSSLQLVLDGNFLLHNSPILIIFVCSPKCALHSLVCDKPLVFLISLLRILSNLSTLRVLESVIHSNSAHLSMFSCNRYFTGSYHMKCQQF